MTKKTLAMLVAELMGTFVLSIVVLSITRYGLPIFTAAAAGLAFAVLTTTFGGVSGAHFNPAITLGMFSIRRINATRALSFVAAQAIGAVLAWKLYEWFAGKAVQLGAKEFDWKVFTAELIGMAIFGLAIATVVYKRLEGQYAAATLGMGLFLGATVASLVSAAGTINPAVAISLGFRPQNVSYVAYFFGPVIGAVLGMGIYTFFADDQVASAPASAMIVEEVVVSEVAARPRKAAARKTATKRTAPRTKKAPTRRK